jgi:hypothetical protein
MSSTSTMDKPPVVYKMSQSLQHPRPTVHQLAEKFEKPAKLPNNDQFGHHQTLIGNKTDDNQAEVAHVLFRSDVSNLGSAQVSPATTRSSAQNGHRLSVALEEPNPSPLKPSEQVYQDLREYLSQNPDVSFLRAMMEQEDSEPGTHVPRSQVSSLGSADSTESSGADMKQNHNIEALHQSLNLAQQSPVDHEDSVEAVAEVSSQRGGSDGGRLDHMNKTSQASSGSEQVMILGTPSGGDQGSSVCPVSDEDPAERSPSRLPTIMSPSKMTLTDEKLSAERQIIRNLQVQRSAQTSKTSSRLQSILDQYAALVKKVDEAISCELQDSASKSTADRLNQKRQEMVSKPSEFLRWNSNSFKERDQAHRVRFLPLVQDRQSCEKLAKTLQVEAPEVEQGGPEAGQAIPASTVQFMDSAKRIDTSSRGGSEGMKYTKQISTNKLDSEAKFDKENLNSMSAGCSVMDRHGGALSGHERLLFKHKEDLRFLDTINATSAVHGGLAEGAKSLYPSTRQQGQELYHLSSGLQLMSQAPDGSVAPMKVALKLGEARVPVPEGSIRMAHDSSGQLVAHIELTDGAFLTFCQKAAPPTLSAGTDAHRDENTKTKQRDQKTVHFTKPVKKLVEAGGSSKRQECKRKPRHRAPNDAAAGFFPLLRRYTSGCAPMHPSRVAKDYTEQLGSSLERTEDEVKEQSSEAPQDVGMFLGRNQTRDGRSGSAGSPVRYMLPIHQGSSSGFDYPRASTRAEEVMEHPASAGG